MNERAGVDRLREAFKRVDINELEEAANELGRQAVAVALAADPSISPNDEGLDGIDRHPPRPQPRRYEPTEEEERQRLLDAALADAIETVTRHRLRLGRRVCSRPDATITRQIYEMLRGMADASGGVDTDPSFQ